MSDLKDKLRIGCSGWRYDDWLGGFYPKGTPKSDYLNLYSGVFDSVEVDSSFSRNPGPATTKGWYKSTPPGFLFSMKMPRRITHEKKLKDVAENLGWFYTSAKELREKAGPLVAQLPPSIKFDSHWALMKDFVKAFEMKYPHAIEFRHKSWFRDDVYALLRDRNVAMVWTENQYLRSPTDVTADYVYLRMVGIARSPSSRRRRKTSPPRCGNGTRSSTGPRTRSRAPSCSSTTTTLDSAPAASTNSGASRG